MQFYSIANSLRRINILKYNFDVLTQKVKLANIKSIILTTYLNAIRAEHAPQS